MGAANSKRKSLFKRIRKKKGDQTRQKQDVTLYYNEDPLYEEIGGELEIYNNDRNVSDETYRTVRSLDSAFCERTSSLTRSNSSSTIVYDEPRVSLHGETNRKEVYRTYLCTDDDNDGFANDSDDDSHTYISEISLREPIGGSPTKQRHTSFNSRYPRKKCNTVVSLDDVPYMVEAFQPLLELTIDVMEVIPHMSFIDAHLFLYVADRTKAVEMLIARIKSSNEPGKWQAFLHALNLAEYEYIVSLLRGETEEDHTVNRNLLKLFTPQIMNRIDPDDFIDHLFEKGVINERDMEEVRCEKDRRGAIAASFMLLHKVPRRVSNWFEVFLDVLVKCGLEDLVPQFSAADVSVCTIEGRKPLNSENDDDYITPIYYNRRSDTKLPQSRKPPPLPVRIAPTFIHGQEQIQQTRPRTELEILTARRNSLQRRVSEMKLIRQYKQEVSALQKELEMLNNEQEDSDIEESEDTVLNRITDSNENTVLKTVTTRENGNPEEEDVINLPEDNTGIDSDTTRVPNAVNASNEQEEDLKEQVDGVQHISALLTDMKQELKDDIIAMRDHVTDTVLKSVMNLITGPAAIENNPYVTVEGHSTLLDPVQLYNTSNRQTRGVLCPKSHDMRRQYSVDSAMFSGYVPVTQYSF